MGHGVHGVWKCQHSGNAVINLSTFTPYYLCQGGYVFTRVCLFLCRITENLHNWLSQNSVKRWNMGH